MLTLPPSVKIFIAATPVRMSKSYDGLANAAREVVAQDPMSGHLFVFFNRGGIDLRGATRRARWQPERLHAGVFTVVQRFRSDLGLAATAHAARRSNSQRPTGPGGLERSHTPSSGTG